MTFHDRGTSWFLAQLKPNCANIADKNLKRQGFKTFLPMEEETSQRGGKFVTAMRPLFPGYIFVAFDAARVLAHGKLDLWHHASGELRQRTDGCAAGFGLATDAAL